MTPVTYIHSRVQLLHVLGVRVLVCVCLGVQVVCVWCACGVRVCVHMASHIFLFNYYIQKGVCRSCFTGVQQKCYGTHPFNVIIILNL